MVKSLNTKARFYYLHFFKIAHMTMSFIRSGIAALLISLIHTVIWIYHYNMQSMKRVQVVFELKRVVVGYVVHYVHNNTMKML